MTVTVVLVAEFSLLVGIVLGWLGSEKYMAIMLKEEHEFDELFTENPHPEIYNKDGKLNKGEYITLNFEPGYDPDEFDPDDIITS